MTDNEPTLTDIYVSSPQGAREFSAAELALEVLRLLRRAMDASGLRQRQLGEELGLSESRVSQVLKGDGNLRISALAKYMHVLGYKVHLTATPLDGKKLPLIGGEPARRTRSRATMVGGAESESKSEVKLWDAGYDMALRLPNGTTLLAQTKTWSPSVLGPMLSQPVGNSEHRRSLRVGRSSQLMYRRASKVTTSARGNDD